MKAVFLDYGTMGPGLNLAPLYALFPGLELYDSTNHEQMIERIHDAEFAFTNKIRFTEELLREAGKLRYIGLTATGTDNIDLATARDNGIAVANIRAYCTQSVVEHVFGTLLMLTHNLHLYRESVRAGEWQASKDFCVLAHPVRELSVMTLGIVGFGALGQGVARVGRAFDMGILVAGRPGVDDVGPERTPFDQVLARADVISLHCPLNDATRNLFDAVTFAKMKAGAILINTARGGLVDSAALVAALYSGHLGGAAIDVLTTEPPIDGDPVLDYTGDNLIVTPHIAWGTNEARQNAIDELAANVAAFVRGELRNRIV